LENAQEKNELGILEKVQAILPNARILKITGFSHENHLFYDRRTADDGEKTPYDLAKEPIKGQKWTYFTSEASVSGWIKAGGWIAAVIPKNRIVVDVDDNTTGKFLKTLLDGESLKHHSIKTPNGFQFIFKASEETTKKIKQITKWFTSIGLVIDIRASGKGYIVFPTENTENRFILSQAENELDEMPAFLRPMKNSIPKQAEEEYHFPIPLVKGSRDNDLYHFACRLNAWGVPKEEGLKNMMLIYKYFMINKADFPENQVKQKWKQGYNWQPENKGYQQNDNVINHPNKYFSYNKQGQLKFNAHLVKDEILAAMPIFRSDIGILRYENGVYKRSLNADIKHTIQSTIKEDATISRKNEVLDLILHENKAIPLSKFNAGYKILNLKNGIYNIADGSFHSHSKKCLWTIQHPIEYNPDAKCPAILDFLHDVLDAESVQFLIEWIAYMMLPYTDTDKIVFLYGSGGNGKGVLLNIIMNLLGVDNISNMSLNDLEEDKFSRANLYGKLSNICGDIDNRIISNTGIIKSLTGGDFVYAQFKGIDGFSFKSFAKLMFSANELPMSKDKTDGWFRRLFILPFNKKVPEEKRISRSELDKKLSSPEELSGLLNLVIAAIHKLEGNGYQFTVSQAAQAALDEYKYVHDKVEQFITEHGQRDNKFKETMKNFYAAYSYWCNDNGLLPEKQMKVKQQLIEKGFKIEKGAGNKVFIYGFSFSKDSEYR
jgi:putative DNA primase/helicase